MATENELFPKRRIHIKPSVKHRLRSKVVINFETGCWEWTGKKDKWGYGRLRMHYKSNMAHRVSYLIHCGKIPEGMYVLHKCDNPSCVNPEHLFLGTQADNLKDMFSKGRNKNQYSYKHIKKPKSSAKPVEALIDGKWIAFETITEGAMQTGAQISKISNVISGKRNKAGGYIWRQKT